MGEAFLEGDLLVTVESLGSDIFDDGEVFGRRPEVLPEREHGDFGGAEIIEGGHDFLFGFSEAEHDPGFGGDLSGSAGELFGALQDVKRAVVFRPGTDERGEALYGLEVVIEDVGAGVDYGLEGIVLGIEIGD